LCWRVVALVDARPGYLICCEALDADSVVGDQSRNPVEVCEASVRVLAVLGFGALELDGGVDEAHVAEGLREGAQLLAAVGVDLLGEEADVVGPAKQLLEEIASTLDLAGEDEIVDEPERADDECAFVAR
jgi:hypothetical protein